MFYDTTLIVLQRIHPDFWGFKWVLKATSPDLDSYQSAFNAIEIQKDLVVSTDGHRLHIYYTKEEHPPGIFKTLAKNKNKLVLEKAPDVKYPEWECILPAEKEIEKELKLTSIDSIGYTMLIRQMEETTTLDFNYFLDLDTDMTVVSIAKDPPVGKTGILFEDAAETKKALIMPMHMHSLGM